MSDVAGSGLVLGGGGVSGIAWEAGILAGLAEAGVDLSVAERIVGTSAGSVVGARIACGTSIETIYADQLADPARARTELPARLTTWGMVRFAYAALMPGDDAAMLRRLGAMALRQATVPEADRRRVIAARLGELPWPERALRITAVDAETGAFVVLDRSAGVPLIDAVAASCAVPLVWPPMTVGGRRLMDGGMRSPVNADLAAGCDPVVVIAPLRRALRPTARLSAQIAQLGPVRSTVITPDDASRRAMGSNLLDPKFRAGSARAGRAQGLRLAAEVADLWPGAQAISS